MEGDGEAGAQDSCASGGRHQEQNERDEGTSLAVMEADVLWSNQSCACLCQSVSASVVNVFVSGLSVTRHV